MRCRPYTSESEPGLSSRPAADLSRDVNPAAFLFQLLPEQAEAASRFPHVANKGEVVDLDPPPLLLGHKIGVIANGFRTGVFSRIYYAATYSPEGYGSGLRHCPHGQQQ